MPVFSIEFSVFEVLIFEFGLSLLTVKFFCKLSELGWKDVDGDDDDDDDDDEDDDSCMDFEQFVDDDDEAGDADTFGALLLATPFCVVPGCWFGNLE